MDCAEEVPSWPASKFIAQIAQWETMAASAFSSSEKDIYSFVIDTHKYDA